MISRKNTYNAYHDASLIQIIPLSIKEYEIFCVSIKISIRFPKKHWEFLWWRTRFLNIDSFETIISKIVELHLEWN